MKSFQFNIARYLLWFYNLFIIYTTLYPFSAWQSNGIGLFEFWSDPKSIYISRMDIWLNVLGYIPLGALWVWRWHPKPNGIVAIFLSTAICSLLSFCLESLQTYLPMRVPSQLDWYTNTFGGFMGASIAMIFSPYVLSKTKIVTWYRLTFNNSSFAICLCILWFLASIFPHPYWFGLGSWVGQIEDINFLVYLVHYYKSLWQYIYSSSSINNWHEILIPFIIVFNLCGMLLAITFGMKNSRIRFSLLIILILFMLKIISLSIYLSIFYLSIPKNVWIGLVLSILIIVIANRFKPITRGIISVIFLILALIFGNILPANLYHEEILYSWQNTKYSHSIGLFKWIGVIIPWMSLFMIIYKISTFKIKAK